MIAADIYTDKIGNPQILLTLAERGREHLVKLRKFLDCSNDISSKISRPKGRTWIQYTLRVISKRIADRLIEFGVTPSKSLTATSIFLS